MNKELRKALEEVKKEHRIFICKIIFLQLLALVIWILALLKAIGVIIK